MPRRTKSIVLDDAGRESLLALEQSGNHQLNMRAQIILYAADHPELNDKNIAEVLGITDKTVRTWKQKYLDSGIKGLAVVHAGGRPPKAMSTDELRRLLEETMSSDPDRNWTASELADRFHVSPKAVFRAIRQSDGYLQRKRIWAYQTWDTVPGSYEQVVGIYIGYNSCVLITANLSQSIEGCTIHGSFITQNRELYQEMEESPLPLGLHDALIGATYHPEARQHGLMPSIDTLVNIVLGEWAEDRAPSVDIYICSAEELQPCRIDGVHIHRSEQISDFRNELISQAIKSGPDANRYYLAIFERMVAFYQVCAAETVPFIWYVPFGEFRSEEIPLPSDTDIPILSNLTDFGTFQKRLHECFNASPPGTSIAGLFNRSDEGVITFTSVNSSYSMELPSSTDLGTFEGFKHAAYVFGQRATHLGRDVFNADCTFEYEIEKKKSR